MLAFQRPLSYLTDRYSIDSDSSDAEQDTLYHKTARIERLTAFTRFMVCLFAFGLLALPLIALLFGLSIVLAFFSGFLETIADIILFVVVVAWIGSAGYVGFGNIRTSEKKKLDQEGGSREVAWALGAREYSSMEGEKLTGAVKQIIGTFKPAKGEKLIVHTEWWVVDTEIPHAVTLGSDLFITTGAIKSPHLVGIIAHELGHIHQHDGQTLASLRSFVGSYLLYRLTNFAGLNKGVLVKQETVTDIKDFSKSLDHGFTFFLYSLWFGGLGVMYYSSQWAEWFRERDYLADDYVISKLNQGQQLKAYLMNSTQFAIGMPYSSSWIAPTELRLDRIDLWDKLQP